jgi:hypothetical protein
VSASLFNLSASGQPRHPWVLWLALWLAVFGAMAPTVSRTLGWVDNDSVRLTEICTGDGPLMMTMSMDAIAAVAPDAAPVDVPDASGATPGQPPSPTLVLDHCAFCTLLTNRLAPPLVMVILPFVLPGKPVNPAVLLTLFLPQFQTPTPPSRAPPTLLNS